MSNLETNKQFLLEQHDQEEYPWQLFVVPDKVTGIKVQITDSNGNNPKITTLSQRQQQLYINVADTLPTYEAIVVKEDEIKDLIRSQFSWFISFDEGVTFMRYFAEVKESNQPGLFWQIILTKVS
jgi:hypothetical protein